MDSENVKPRSIGQIHSKIGAKWFRVRNVANLRDYLILEFTQIGFVATDPRWANVVCLDDQIYGTLDCTERKYALLSSLDELAMYRRHKKAAVTSSLFDSYNRNKDLDEFVGPYDD